jgi:hypothetical protein
VVVGDFNTPLLPIDKSFRQKKNNKEILELNDTIDQMDLTDVNRIYHLAPIQYPFFSAVNGIFSKTEHVVGQKTTLQKYKKIKITLMHTI